MAVRLTCIEDAEGSACLNSLIKVSAGHSKNMLLNGQADPDFLDDKSLFVMYSLSLVDSLAAVKEE